MKEEYATFAGGCFWCMEAAFDCLDGVMEAVSGYTGGKTETPSYEEVSSGATGHYEAVHIMFDPSKISYEQLLDIFWKNIDPTDSGGQFADRGSQYKSAIFYHNEEQRLLAEDSKKRLEESGKFKRPILTDIVKFEIFYPAEEYHQGYHKKCPLRYDSYKKGSGREDFVKKMWSKDDLKSRLTPLQYSVTQEHGTEEAFNNEYWDNKRDGIYVDIVSGEPLFSSLDKFDSGTGWPSFTRPINEGSIVTREDSNMGMKRVEALSKNAKSHLGHVFEDGPKPTGKRFCMNSAALRFVPREKLEEEGYGKYKKIFEK